MLPRRRATAFARVWFLEVLTVSMREQLSFDYAAAVARPPPRVRYLPTSYPLSYARLPTCSNTSWQTGGGATDGGVGDGSDGGGIGSVGSVGGPPLPLQCDRPQPACAASKKLLHACVGINGRPKRVMRAAATVTTSSSTNEDDGYALLGGPALANCSTFGPASCEAWPRGGQRPRARRRGDSVHGLALDACCEAVRQWCCGGQ